MKKLYCLLLIFTFTLVLHDYSSARDRGEDLFSEALSLYIDLASSPEKSSNKQIWDTIARAFYSVYENYTDSTRAPDALFISGRMYEEIGNRFDSRSDYDRSISLSREFVIKYPSNDLADDAQIRIARIVEKIGSKSEAYIEYQRVVDNFPRGDMVHIARNKLGELSPFKPAAQERRRTYTTDTRPKITKIRHWSTDNYTRVVIHVNEELPFESRFLRADPQINTPPRLYVDVKDVTIDNQLYVEPVEKGLLEQIKFGRNTDDTVRVVLYINSFEDYRVFSLTNPYRIVMDIQGEGADPYRIFARDDGKQKTQSPTSVTRRTPGTESQPRIETLRQALGLKIRTVVIDPGHGGHDPGAIGPTGLKEKDVVLQISHKLKEILEKNGQHIGIENVYMTRYDDRFVPLEERTAIARKHNADLFISIHANASTNRNAQGLETYVMGFTEDRRVLALAARENAQTAKRVSDLKEIIQNYLTSSKIEESEKFARYVQNSIYAKVSPSYQPFVNRGYKKAPFIVLIGADIPSILVETSFISNPTEEKRLRDPKFREKIAQGIFSGIKQYASEIETAHISP